MKKNLLIAFLGFFLASGAYAYSLKFLDGFSLNNYAISPDRYQGIDWESGLWFRQEAGQNNGRAAGAGIEFSLTRELSLEVDAIYVQKGCHLDIFREDYPADTAPYREFEMNLDVLSLPVLAKIQFSPESSPYILGGLEISYVLKHHGEARGRFGNIIDGWGWHKIDWTDSTKRFDFGPVVGAGVQVKFRTIWIFVEVRYLYGLANISKMYSLESIKTRSRVILFGFKV